MFFITRVLLYHPIRKIVPWYHNGLNRLIPLYYSEIKDYSNGSIKKRGDAWRCILRFQKELGNVLVLYLARRSCILGVFCVYVKNINCMIFEEVNLSNTSATVSAMYYHLQIEVATSSWAAQDPSGVAAFKLPGQTNTPSIIKSSISLLFRL